MFNPFSRAPRGGAAWFNAGPVSSFPDIEADPGPVGKQRKCNDIFTPGCKVFYVPREDATSATPVAIDDWKDGETDTKDQVMVFRYSGKVVAVNHVCAAAQISLDFFETKLIHSRNVHTLHIHCPMARRLTLRTLVSSLALASRAQNMIGASTCIPVGAIAGAID